MGSAEYSKLLIDNDVTGVTGVLRLVLRVKPLNLNNVTDVTGVMRATRVAQVQSFEFKVQSRRDNHGLAPQPPIFGG